MPSGAHGGGGSGGPRPFGPGLSVEELKEMTKLRLQQQGRSSPTFASRGHMSGGLANGGVVHERTEWRRSGSAGSAAMMEEHHRGRDDGSAPVPFRWVAGVVRGIFPGMDWIHFPPASGGIFSWPDVLCGGLPNRPRQRCQ